MIPIINDINDLHHQMSKLVDGAKKPTGNKWVLGFIPETLKEHICRFPDPNNEGYWLYRGNSYKFKFI